jgi:hypothetical protein
LWSLEEIIYPSIKKVCTSLGQKTLQSHKRQFLYTGCKQNIKGRALRGSVERVNSRLDTFLSKITFKGWKAAATQVSYAVLSLLFIAQTAIKTGKPEKTRSITYYV